MLRLDADGVYRAGELDRLAWLSHGFGTRLTSGWPATERLATARQIHSNKVLIAQHPGVIGDGDALISNQPGIQLAVRTADCLPVLMADRRNRVVAAVHAGWRGAVSDIVTKTVEALAREFGSRAQDLVVAIGPGIGACCFEVGPEVAVQFGAFFPERNDLSQRTKVNLEETITRQLRRNGVTASQVARGGLCTCCRSESFESYRRDREAAGRMVAAIGLRAQ